MTVECGTCGYDNHANAELCELCGAPLEPEPGRGLDEQPHRVPTGVGIKRPDDRREHRTDVGMGGTSTRPGHTRQGHVRTASEVGEVATHEAATDSPSYRGRPRPDLISSVGELAGDAALSKNLPTAGDRLLGRVKLVVEQGRIISEQYLLSEPDMIIGRADHEAQTYPDIDLSGQDNEYVHRVHARLQFHDLATRLSVEHLGGVNPTLVNNFPVEPGELVELRPGDRLRVGRVVMRLQRVEE